MKKKINNKGFSLVELIVVMAIMAILAVTLATKLSQYIDKARQANDRETVNAIYTAIKLGMLDDKVYDSAPAVNNDASPATDYVLKLNGVATTFLYTAANKVWTLNTAIADDDLFKAQIGEVVGSFKLQSNLAETDSQITITVKSPTMFSVTLDYDGTTGGVDFYTVNSDVVAVD